MHSLKLLSLKCYVPDEADLDEAYLKIGGKKIWPESEKYVRVPHGDTSVGTTIGDLNKGDSVVVELWDYDSFSFDDKLGDFNLILDQFGKFETELKRHKGTPASYGLEWEFY